MIYSTLGRLLASKCVICLATRHWHGLTLKYSSANKNAKSQNRVLFCLVWKSLLNVFRMLPLLKKYDKFKNHKERIAERRPVVEQLIWWRISGTPVHTAQLRSKLSEKRKYTLLSAEYCKPMWRLRFDTHTLCSFYILTLLTYSDATLCDIYFVLCYVL